MTCIYCICLSVCTYNTCVQELKEVRRRPEPSNWSYRQQRATMLVLGIKARTSGRTASASNLWGLYANSPAIPPHTLSLLFLFCCCFFGGGRDSVSISSDWPWTHDPHNLSLPCVGLQARANNHGFTALLDNSTGYFPSTSSQCIHKWQFLFPQICFSSHVPDLNDGNGNLFKWLFVFGDPQEHPQFQGFPRRMPRAGEGYAVHIAYAGLASRECSHLSHASWLQGQGENTPAVPAFLPWGTGPDSGNGEPTNLTFSCFLPNDPRREKKSSCYRDGQWVWHIRGQKWNKVSPLLVRSYC